MSRYKPTYEVATELVRKQFLMNERTVAVPLKQATGCIAAKNVLAEAPFPATNLSMRDGFAVDRPREATRAERIATGDPLPDWASTIVPEELWPLEEFEGDDPLGGRPVMVEQGDEYQQGDIIVAAGEKIDHHHIAQLILMGVDRVPVYRPPRINLLVFKQERFGATVSTWLDGFLRLYFPVEIQVDFIHSIEHGLTLASGDEADLFIMVSDSAPGRYAQFKQLDSGTIDQYEPIFWKLDLHPCKHLGFGLNRGKPLLVFPDLFFKTVLSAFAFLPPLLASWAKAKLFTRPANWVGLPEIHYPYPCIVPLRFGAERRGLKVFATPLKSTFSARHACAAQGYTILEKAPLKDDEFETIIVGRFE